MNHAPRDRLLLTICPCWNTDSPPVGLAHLEAYLGAAGIAVQVLDLNIELFHAANPAQRELWSMARSHDWWLPEVYAARVQPALEPLIEAAVARLCAHPASVIGFSVFVTNRLFTRDVIARLRRRCHKTIVVGGRGVFAAIERDDFPAAEVDYFCLGDGEEPLVQLMRGAPEIAGLMRPGEPEVTPALFEQFAAMPLVTYEGFELQRYTDRRLTVLLNRGCSFRCAFCNDWGYIGRRRTRRPEHLQREIEHHFYSHGINEIYFNDQAINVDCVALRTLCELLAQAPYAVEWVALAIPNRSLDGPLLAAMRAAGCKTLNFGVETGSQRVLRLMNKGLRIAEVERVLEQAFRAGINATLNFVVGFPGETEADFEESLAFFERNRAHVTGVTNANLFDAIIGCAVERDPARFGVVIPDEPRPRYRNWYTVDRQNTLAVRRARLERLIARAKELACPVWSTNLY